MIRKVLALVVDYRTTADTEALTCQLSGARHDGFNLTIAHVDNGNETPVTLSSEQAGKGIRLLRIAHNGGYASGLRQAINRLEAEGDRYDAYWLLNSDLEIEPDSLQKLVEVLQRRPRVAAVGPTVRRGRTQRVWGARGVVSPLLGITAMVAWPQGGVLPRWSYLPGCSLLVRAEAYRQVGGIPDRYGMYYEETHLCIQLQKRGWDLWVEPDALVYHRVGEEESGMPSPHHAFYFARNNLYFWQANFGIPWLLQLPRTLFVVAKDLVFPLRHAKSAADALERLRFIGMGLADSVAFLRQRFTPFERRHFSLEPPAESRVGR
jgi:GT2 family glycosyltransferase